MKEREVFRNTSRVKEERYNYAVGIAADLFLEKGIEAVKMTDIAENSGIGVASLYRFFETKTEIVIRAGSILWKRINSDFLEYINRWNGKTGMDKLVYDLGYFRNLYVNHRSFIKFLDDFDHIMLEEKVPKERLREYESSVVNFYVPLSDACEMGKMDGTIRKDASIFDVYFSVTHALLAVCQKFIRGEILPGDNFSNAGKEIEKLLELTAAYLAA